MAILGLIIKIILFALIAIFLLILWIFLFVIFSPIRYEVFINNDDDPQYIAHINLFFLIKIVVKRQNNNTSTHIYLFGTQLKRRKTKEPKLKKKRETKSKKENTKIKLNKNQADKKQTSKEEKNIKSREIYNKQPKNESLEKSSKKIKESLTKERGNLEALMKYIRNEYFMSFFKAATRLLLDVMNIFKPYIFRFQVVIGSEDAAETGMLMSKILAFYPLYCKYGVIEGDYVNPCFTVNLELMGKLNLFRILKKLIVFIWNKDSRQYIKFIMNARKEE